MEKKIPSIKLDKTRSRKWLKANASALQYPAPEKGKSESRLMAAQAVSPSRIFKKNVDLGHHFDKPRHPNTLALSPFANRLKSSPESTGIDILSTCVDSLSTYKRHPVDLQKPLFWPLPPNPKNRHRIDLLSTGVDSSRHPINRG